MRGWSGRTRPAWMIATAMALAGWMCVGCQSGARGEGNPTYAPAKVSDGSAAGDYEAGLYTSAYAKSSREAAATSGARHERAALIAGMSAHAMNRSEDAERWLGPLTMSSDREVAGRASATLGLIEQSRGRHARAAQLFDDAAVKLSGAEATRARSAAAESRRAQERGTTGVATSIAGGGAFALQLGAFSSRANADGMAKTSSSPARSAGLGEPWVSLDRDSRGRSLWVVRVGSFSSRAEAVRAQRTFPKAIVVETGRPTAGAGTN